MKERRVGGENAHQRQARQKKRKGKQSSRKLDVEKKRQSW